MVGGGRDWMATESLGELFLTLVGCWELSLAFGKQDGTKMESRRLQNVCLISDARPYPPTTASLLAVTTESVKDDK